MLVVHRREQMLTRMFRHNHRLLIGVVPPGEIACRPRTAIHGCNLAGIFEDQVETLLLIPIHGQDRSQVRTRVLALLMLGILNVM
jgi:hypothetical protein